MAAAAIASLVIDVPNRKVRHLRRVGENVKPRRVRSEVTASKVSVFASNGFNSITLNTKGNDPSILSARRH